MHLPSRNFIKRGVATCAFLKAGCMQNLLLDPNSHNEAGFVGAVVQLLVLQQCYR